MKQKATQKTRAIWYVLVIVVLFFIAVFALLVYRTSKQQNLTIYLSKVDKIQQESNPSIQELNISLNQFQGDAQSAANALPRLKESKKTLEATSRKIKRLPYPNKAKSYRKSLIQYYEQSATFFNDLARVAQFIINRIQILQQLAKDIQSFDEAIKNAKSDQEILEAARSLKESADKAHRSLEKLSRPKILPYSNEVFFSYLTSISEASELLSKGIEEQDIKMLQDAVNALRTVFSQNWEDAQFVEDKKGMGKYKKKIEEIKKIRREAMQERQDLEQIVNS